jgi:hypothetical protein
MAPTPRRRHDPASAEDAPRSIRGRPSGLKGRSALAARRPPAAPDPGASTAPLGRQTARAGQGLPSTAARRPTRARRQHETTIRSLYGSRGLPKLHIANYQREAVPNVALYNLRDELGQSQDDVARALATLSAESCRISTSSGFSTSSSRAHRGLDARGRRRPGRGRFVALVGSSLAALGLARTCQKVSREWRASGRSVA